MKHQTPDCIHHSGGPGNHLIGLICNVETIPKKSPAGIWLHSYFHLDNFYHIYLTKSMLLVP